MYLRFDYKYIPTCNPYIMRSNSVNVISVRLIIPIYTHEKFLNFLFSTKASPQTKNETDLNKKYEIV